MRPTAPARSWRVYVPFDRLTASLLALSLVLLSLAPLPADEPIPFAILTCSEPNDGELLGSVLLLEYDVDHPAAHRMAAYLGNQRIAIEPVTAGECTLFIDTSQLPNGEVALEVRLLTLSGAVITSEIELLNINHPETVLTNALFHSTDLMDISLAIFDETSAGETVPYALLVSREDGDGLFPVYDDLHLPFTPAETSVITGTIALDLDGTGVLDLDIDESDVTLNSPVRIQLLLFREGAWSASGAISIGP